MEIIFCYSKFEVSPTVHLIWMLMIVDAIIV